MTVDKLLGGHHLYFFLYNRTDALMLYKAIMKACKLLHDDVKNDTVVSRVSMSFDSSALFGIVKGSHDISVGKDGVKMSNKREPIGYSQIYSLHPCEKNPSKITINAAGNNILTANNTVQLKNIDNAKDFVLAYFANAWSFRSNNAG